MINYFFWLVYLSSLLLKKNIYSYIAPKLILLRQLKICVRISWPEKVHWKEYLDTTVHRIEPSDI